MLEIYRNSSDFHIKLDDNHNYAFVKEEIKSIICKVNALIKEHKLDLFAIPRQNNFNNLIIHFTMKIKQHMSSDEFYMLMDSSMWKIKNLFPEIEQIISEHAKFKIYKSEKLNNSDTTDIVNIFKYAKERTKDYESTMMFIIKDNERKWHVALHEDLDNRTKMEFVFKMNLTKINNTIDIRNTKCSIDDETVKMIEA